jgi:hypothetical protein
MMARASDEEQEVVSGEGGKAGAGDERQCDASQSGWACLVGLKDVAKWEAKVGVGK